MIVADCADDKKLGLDIMPCRLCQKPVRSTSTANGQSVRSVRLALPIAGVPLFVVAFVLIGCGEQGAPAVVIPLDQVRRQTDGRLTIWWDDLPESVTAEATSGDGAQSNIHRTDYVGPEACRNCHKENYKNWSSHPHRWMNAIATDSTVRGDFDSAEINYRNGMASFERRDGAYLMKLERGESVREYEIEQTIGSRFFQYYVGKLRNGPEPETSPLYHVDHVLPFGYWMDEDSWVPVVHIDDELPDHLRLDPFDAKSIADNFRPYSTQCNYCHTTFTLGDMMVRATGKVGRHAPRELNFFTSSFLAEDHPEIWDGSRHPSTLTTPQMLNVMKQMVSLTAPEHAVTLGVSCEACHLGSRRHAAGKQKRPSFVPQGSEVFVAANDSNPVSTGRSHDNINWACGRCHTGNRPQFAAGMSTWNSTEYDDAMKGSCYSKLTCVECHNPHKAMGKSWSLSAAQDDAVCLNCHSKYNQAATRLQHTHHRAGSSGDRCMNCHMPRLNEGLQDVVRTHMIFSPTNREMLEQAEPNACNLCHTDETIGWTLGHLNDWYESGYPVDRIQAGYESPGEPAAMNWLKSGKESVRLIGADALCKSGAKWALPELFDMLDDSYLINRQFTQRRIEKMLAIRLSEYGYQFYMTRIERKDGLAHLRAEFARASDVTVETKADND